MKKVVLITGCSSGIGRDLAQRLARAGCSVIATARNVSSIEDLDTDLKLSLDVTQAESIRTAVEATLQKYGRIDVLVNNAGYAQVGAIEELSDQQIYQMYDVNLFGVIRMVRAVLPTMRKQNAGQIINISSIAGRVVTPANGSYSSTKFALEAISDALQLEVEPFNIQVILIEPGAIRTNFDQTVHAHGDAIISNPASPYRSLYQKHQQVSNGMRGQEPGPEAVSAVVQRTMESAKPKTRYLVGMNMPGRLVLYLRDYLWNTVVRQLYSAS